jgi:hypothetical protein
MVKRTRREKREAKAKQVFTDEPRIPEGGFKKNAKLEMLHIYNWYSDFCPKEKAWEYLSQYMNTIPRYQKYAESISNMIIVPFYGHLARIIMLNGNNCPSNIKLYLMDKIDELIDKVEIKKSNRRESSDFRSRVVNAIKEQSDALLSDLEVIIDKRDTNYNLYEDFTKKEVNIKVAREILSELSPRYDEIKNGIAGSEEYSSYNPKELAKLEYIFRILIQDLNSYISGKKEIKKALRQTKKLSTKVRLSKKDPFEKFNYQKESKEYKVVSITPTSIPGVQRLWVLNTKYKWVGYYEAEMGKKLAVSGTSINNFDATKSFFKRLRKPEEFLKLVGNVPEAKLLRTFQELKTDQNAIRSRINEDTILLRVVK